MSRFAAMGSALHGRLGTVQYTYRTSGTATTTGTLGAWDTVSGQGTATPYVIYQLQSALSTYTFGTVAFESAEYAVKTVSSSLWPSYQAYAIHDQTHTALQDALLTIPGGTPLRVRLMSRFAYQDAEQFWHVGGIYRVDSYGNS